MNEMEGSYTDEDGQVTVTRDVDQMVKYFNQIRYRAGQPGITTADAADQSRMRELIKHERLIEFAFESHRYWICAVGKMPMTLTTNPSED